MKRLITLWFVMVVNAAFPDSQVEVKGVTAQQRYPWNGLVDIVVTMQGAVDEVAKCDCLFVATNVETKAAVHILHITRNGNDSGSGTTWTRKFIWDAKADVGAVKIDDVALTATAEIPLGGVQLWENGPYWAECNVGATKPEECGYYFWWGDTVGYKRNENNDGWISVKDSTGFAFRSGNCPTYGKDDAQLQLAGYIDPTGNLATDHDAATAYLGGPWRMPTVWEFDYILSNCDVQLTMCNGVYGLRIKGIGKCSSKSLFLPAASCGDDSAGDDTIPYEPGSMGYYWSSTTDSNNSYNALDLIFNPRKISSRIHHRYFGLPVRPLRGSADAVGTMPAGVTTRFALDCREDVRMVSECGEGLCYNIGWYENADQIRITDNGTVVMSGISGCAVWRPEPSCSTRHILELEAFVDDRIVATETAEFATSVPELEHIHATTFSAVEPTCTTAGRTAEVKCSRCGATLETSKEVPALGHVRTTTVFAVEPTCTSAGRTAEVKCSRCGATLETSEEVPALGHVRVTTISAVEPTCTMAGRTEEVKCSRCGATLETSEVIPSLGHCEELVMKSIPDGISPTAAESWCTRCGDVLLSGFLSVDGNWVYELVGNDVRICRTVKEDASIAIPGIIDGHPVGAIGDRAFSSCCDLTEVEIPCAITNISPTAFSGCAKVTDVALVSSSGETRWTHILYTIFPDSRQALCRIVVGEGVDGILMGAFAGFGNIAVKFEGSQPAVVDANDMTVYPDAWSEGVFGPYASIDSNVCAYYHQSLWEEVSRWCGVPCQPLPDVTITPGGKYKFTDSVSVSMICSHRDAVIHYTTDGREPTEASTVYKKAMTVNRKVTIKAMAVSTNCPFAGDVAVAQFGMGYTANPAISSEQGTTFWYRNNMVTLTCSTSGVELYYTTDGSDPVEKGVLYTEPFLISESTIVKVVAKHPTNLDSDVVEQEFTRNRYTVATPEIKTGTTVPLSESVNTVVLSCSTENAVIYYSTGSDYAVYSGPFKIDKATTVTAYAVKDDWTRSETAERTILKTWYDGSAVGVADWTFISESATPWTTDDRTSYDGGSSLRSGAIGDGEASDAQTSVSGKGTFSFQWKVSCEDDPDFDEWDHVSFYVDGVEKARLDGVSVWTAYSIHLDTAGTHVLKWVYVKDGSYSEGEDCAWIDAVSFLPDPEVVDGVAWSYVKHKDGVQIISGADEYVGELTIPDRICGYPVTSIGDHAFDGCDKLTSVVMPSSVTSIGSYAFYNCSGLTSVTIPEGVSSIGQYAFEYCRGMKSVTMPASLTSIGRSAFYGCGGLAAVYVADLAAWCGIGFGSYDANPLNYAGHLYLNGEEIDDLVVPAGVTGIGSFVFYDCVGITSVTIPSSVVSVGSQAFLGCDGLKSVIISEGVESVGDHAFWLCKGLAAVTMPLSMQNIGEGAFGFCPIEVVFVTNEPNDCVKKHFGDQMCYQKIGVPINYEWECSVKNGHAEVTGVRPKFGNMVIPSSYEGAPVTSIGIQAFRNCSGLETVKIPSSVTSVGYEAFSGCNGLTSVVIAEGVTRIGEGMFRNCGNLESVTIPSSVTSIGRAAFDGTPYYNNQPDGMVILGSVLYGVKGEYPSSVAIPSNVTSIGDYAFGECDMLTSVAIPASVTSIGEGVFYGCSGLQSISVSPENEDFDVVNGCLLSKDGLKLVRGPAKLSVAIPDSVQIISSFAFESCSALTSVEIPLGVTWIGEAAFQGCSGLKSVTIHKGVSSVGFCAFAGCGDLKTVYVDAGDAFRIQQLLDRSDGVDVRYLSFVELAAPETFPSAEGMTEGQVAQVFVGSADPNLASNITGVEAYAKFREWAMKIGAAEVKASPNAWVSFAVDSTALLAKMPTDEDLKIEEFTPSATAGTFEFTVSVKDVTIGDQAIGDTLKKLFGLEGAESLDQSVFSSSKVAIGTMESKDGKLKFTATPVDKSVSTFFMKMKVK